MIQQMLVIWPLVQPWTLVISRLLKAFPIFSFIFVPWFISLVFPHIIYYRSILFIFVSLICGCKTVKCFKIFALFLKFNTALIKLFSLFLQVFKNSGLYFCFSYLCVCVCVCVYSHTHTHTYTLRCIQLFVAPWTVVHKVPLPIEFSRQEYCSGVPFLPPGDLPHPWVKPPYVSCIGRQILYTSTTWEAPTLHLYFSWNQHEEKFSDIVRTLCVHL